MNEHVHEHAGEYSRWVHGSRFETCECGAKRLVSFGCEPHLWVKDGTVDDPKCPSPEKFMLPVTRYAQAVNPSRRRSRVLTKIIAFLTRRRE